MSSSIIKCIIDSAKCFRMIRHEGRTKLQFSTLSRQITFEFRRRIIYMTTGGLVG